MTELKVLVNEIRDLKEQRKQLYKIVRSDNTTNSKDLIEEICNISVKIEALEESINEVLVIADLRLAGRR